jgi:Ca2+-transporting ATPase
MMASVPPSQAAILPYTEVEGRLRTNSRTGLNTVEANRRRALYGVNDFQINNEEPLWKKYLDQVK